MIIKGTTQKQGRENCYCPHDTNLVLLQAITSQGIDFVQSNSVPYQTKFYCCEDKWEATNVWKRCLNQIMHIKAAKMHSLISHVSILQSSVPNPKATRLTHSQKHKFNCFLLLNVPPLPQNYYIAWKWVNQAPVLHQHCTRLCTATCQNKCVLHPPLRITLSEASQFQILCTEWSLNHELLSNQILKEMFAVVSNDKWSLSIVQWICTNKVVARLDHL